MGNKLFLTSSYRSSYAFLKDKNQYTNIAGWTPLDKIKEVSE
jgi:hypothetical protein